MSGCTISSNDGTVISENDYASLISVIPTSALLENILQHEFGKMSIFSLYIIISFNSHLKIILYLQLSNEFCAIILVDYRQALL